MLQVRLYRPFSAEHFLAALPDSCRAIAVLEQTKESGAPGEPLYLDVVTTLAQAVAGGRRRTMPRVIGGRYGLGSKNFNPAQAKAVFDELKKSEPKNGFTVGIDDDVSHTSLAVDPTFSIERDDVVRALFYGLGADGTVGANKNSVKIIAEDPEMHAQGYFVYDSHKSGAQTISHLRFGKQPIRSPYLIESANFVACHQAGFLDRIDVLRLAAQGRHVPAQHAAWTGQGVGPAAALAAGADPRQEASLLRDRRLQGRARHWPRRADQHGPADLLLRDFRRAAARRGDPAHQAVDREELRRQGCRRGAQEFRGRRSHAGAPLRGDRAGFGDERVRPAADRAGAGARIRARGHRQDDARTGAATTSA